MRNAKILMFGVAAFFAANCSPPAFAGCDCKCKDAKGVVHLGDKLNSPDIKDLAKRCRETCAWVYSQPTEPVGACMVSSGSSGAAKDAKFGGATAAH
jgi:hypothetical protein